MTVPIHLDDQMQGWTIEIDNIVTNAMLSAEFYAKLLLIQSQPKAFFWCCHITA